MTFKVNEAPEFALSKISEAEIKERLKRGLIFSPSMSEYGKTFFNELKSQLKQLTLKNDATQEQIDEQVKHTINLLTKFHNDIREATDVYVLGRKIRHTDHIPMSYRVAVHNAHEELMMKYAVMLEFRKAKK